MAKILVIGGSRGIGLETVKYGLELGHAMTAFARTANGIKLDHPNLTRFDGDAMSSPSLSDALEGIDVVIQSLGVPLGFDIISKPVHLFSESTRHLIPAMKETGVRRLLCVTGYGAGESEAALGCLERMGFHTIFGRAYSDKTIQEELIRESSLDWTIVRPVVLTSGNRTERYRVLTDEKDWSNGLISRADVAHFLVNEATSNRYVGSAPILKY